MPPDNPSGRGAGPGIPEETLRAIAELKDLRVLYLGFSAIHSDGLRTLASLDKVEKLGLQGCSRIDDAALSELAKWKNLKYVDVQATPVTEKGLVELRNARPGIRILSGGARRLLLLLTIGDYPALGRETLRPDSAEPLLAGRRYIA